MPGRIAGKLAAERGIGSRFGCHCAHLYVKRLFHFSVAQEKIQRFVLKMIPALRLQGMLRISVGMLNTREDALTLLETLHAISDPKGSTGNHSAIKSSYKRNLKQFIHQRKQLVFGGSE
jgi:selenocysteine lyase/cysteine desulfurase